jgi:hypothetical protein
MAEQELDKNCVIWHHYSYYLVSVPNMVGKSLKHIVQEM